MVITMNNAKKVFGAATSKTRKSPRIRTEQKHYNIPFKKGQVKYKLDFAEINERIRNHFPNFVSELLPYGKQQGNEWLALNPTRSDQNIGSFHINLRTLQFYDFATGEGGTGAIALYAYVKNIQFYEAAKILNKKIKGANK